MKKAFVSSVYLGILAACSQGTPPTSPQNTTYPTATVGASVSSIETNPFFQGMYASFEQVGKEQDSLKIFVDSASNNQEKQDAQLQDMVKRGAKALVVNLADVKQGGAFVKRLCQEKIPVVYINRNPGDKDSFLRERIFRGRRCSTSRRITRFASTQRLEGTHRLG